MLIGVSVGKLAVLAFRDVSFNDNGWDPNGSLVSTHYSRTQRVTRADLLLGRAHGGCVRARTKLAIGRGCAEEAGVDVSG